MSGAQLLMTYLFRAHLYEAQLFGDQLFRKYLFESHVVLTLICLASIDDKKANLKAVISLISKLII